MFCKSVDSHELGITRQLQGIPHIIKLISAKSLGNGKFEMTLEQLPFTWQTLPGSKGSPLELIKALEIAYERFGFVHRDIHSGQIVFDKDRQPYLIDFGRSETKEYPFMEGRIKKSHFQDVMDILHVYNIKLDHPFPKTVREIIERMEGSKYICFSCGNPSETICGGCALFSYCSKDCQAEHFEDHQELCQIASADVGNIVRQGGYWVKLLRAKGVENLENSVRRRELNLNQLRDLEKVLSGRNSRKYRTLKRMVAEEIGRLSR